MSFEETPTKSAARKRAEVYGDFTLRAPGADDGSDSLKINIDAVPSDTKAAIKEVRGEVDPALTATTESPYEITSQATADGTIADMVDQEQLARLQAIAETAPTVEVISDTEAVESNVSQAEVHGAVEDEKPQTPDEAPPAELFDAHEAPLVAQEDNATAEAVEATSGTTPEESDIVDLSPLGIESNVVNTQTVEQLHSLIAEFDQTLFVGSSLVGIERQDMTVAYEQFVSAVDEVERVLYKHEPEVTAERQSALAALQASVPAYAKTLTVLRSIEHKTNEGVSERLELTEEMRTEPDLNPSEDTESEVVQGEHGQTVYSESEAMHRGWDVAPESTSAPAPTTEVPAYTEPPVPAVMGYRNFFAAEDRDTGADTQAEATEVSAVETETEDTEGESKPEPENVGAENEAERIAGRLKQISRLTGDRSTALNTIAKPTDASETAPVRKLTVGAVDTAAPETEPATESGIESSEDFKKRINAVLEATADAVDQKFPGQPPESAADVVAKFREELNNIAVLFDVRSESSDERYPVGLRGLIMARFNAAKDLADQALSAEVVEEASATNSADDAAAEKQPPAKNEHAAMNEAWSDSEKTDETPKPTTEETGPQFFKEQAVAEAAGDEVMVEDLQMMKELQSFGITPKIWQKGMFGGISRALSDRQLRAVQLQSNNQQLLGRIQELINLAGVHAPDQKDGRITMGEYLPALYAAAAKNGAFEKSAE